jgi:50S ribosome-binding GTPase
MGSIDHRSAVGQLADDLRWLEDHCRRETELAPHAGILHLASALARNVIGPFLEGQPANPLHVAVVGGAGAGKSTVVNFLAGATVAETNPQAGYTRHPTAFLPAAQVAEWPSSIGFMGTLQRINSERPANADEDVYQVQRLPGPTNGDDALDDFVIWDCPDMTTWASGGYVNRLMEVAALADVIVYVASDERYNDEVPTQFLHLLIKSGKSVIVVLTKAREADLPVLADHFRRDVLGRLPRLPNGSTPAVPVVAFPHMQEGERADPAGAGAKHRISLLNQVLVQCESDTATRARTVTNAARNLSSASAGLLEVARRDLAEYDAWKSCVAAGKLEFEERYRKEYLSGERFQRFDRHREELMNLLELPGAGRVLGGMIWLLRTPYRWTRDYVAGLIARPEVFNLSEPAVLNAALNGWLDRLHAEALRRAPTHALWKSIAARFETELAPQARQRFEQDRRGFELKETDELEQSGKALVEGLETNALLLYTLRIGKFALDVAVIVAILIQTWLPSWYHVLLIFVAVSMTHQVTELIVRGVVEAARARVRKEREALMRSSLTTTLGAWLAEWPASGGSAIEKLQQVLRRVPETIQQLEERVRNKVAEWSPDRPTPTPPPLPQSTLERTPEPT